MASAPAVVPSLIYLDEQGRARIVGTRFKVIHIARDRKQGLDANAIQEAYPDLTLAQVHAALSYYFEHQVEYDALMEQEDREVAAFLASHTNPVSREELLGRLDSD